MSAPLPSTHRQILKSSALIGGSSVVNVLLGLIRTKFAAIYLGTAGVGLMETLFSLTTLASTLAGLGVGRSGVRQMAEANSTEDPRQIARAALIIRRLSLAMGLAGSLLLACLAWPASQWTFGSAAQAVPVAILSATVVMTCVSNGQIALIQGCRRIGELACANTLGVLLSIVLALPLMVLWGQKSVVPILLGNAAMALGVSWWFARKLARPAPGLPWRETWAEAGPLLKLGFAFVASGLMATGVAYLTRVIINRSYGLEATGLYGAAWKISGFYVGFILEAMGADFFPRLSAAAKDHTHTNQLVNEQTEVSLLLTLPGLVATLAFAPWIIQLLYSADFLPAGEILRWQVLGLVLRVLSWPMGFILIVQGKTAWFLGCEIAANLVHLGCIWLGLAWWGLPGTGMAFLGLYLFYAILMAVVTRRMTGFRWSASNARLLLLVGGIAILVFLSVLGLPPIGSAAVGMVMVVAASWYSVRTLARLSGGNPLSAAFLKLKGKFGKT